MRLWKSIFQREEGLLRSEKKTEKSYRRGVGESIPCYYISAKNKKILINEFLSSICYSSPSRKCYVHLLDAQI
mgnify:CR=1 FL=1